MPPGLEPKSGSVRPKQPIASPVAIRGSHSSFWASDPCFQIANIARLPWTETTDRSPESPASSSRQARPYAVALVPAQPYPVRCIPSSPIDPNSRASSRTGAVPASYHPAISGLSFSSTKLRTVSRMARSSSADERVGVEQLEGGERHAAHHPRPSTLV